MIGLLGGIKAELDLPTILFRRIRLIGIFLGAMTIEWAQQAWEGIVALMEQAGRRPLVDSVYPPEAAREAFGRLRSGPLGKVLVGPM